MPVLTPNPEFGQLASDAQLESTAAALRANNIGAVVVATGADAKQFVLDNVPEGAQVHSGASKTLDDIGLTAELQQSARHDWLRSRLFQMDRQTQANEIRKLGGTPEIMLGSAAAVTEDGVLVIASATGSQLGPIASGAGKVILVVGSQKIVPDLSQALRRVQEYAFPLEDARAQVAYGRTSQLNKTLIVSGDLLGRFTVVLVREALGF